MFASKLRSALIYLSGAALMLGMGSAAANDWPLNLRQGVTTISQQVFDLHMLIFWICVVACVLVFAVLIYSIMTHRKSKGAVPATFHESTTVEIIWTTIPFLVLVGMAVPATKALLALEDTRNADLSIKVTGYQWKWKYDYLDGEAEGISFMSNLDEKSNEITHVDTLLDQVELDGMVVTADAMHTQRAAAHYLVQQRGADYVFTIKKNQPELLKKAQRLLPASLFFPEETSTS